MSKKLDIDVLRIQLRKAEELNLIFSFHEKITGLKNFWRVVFHRETKETRILNLKAHIEKNYSVAAVFFDEMVELNTMWINIKNWTEK